MRQTEAEKGWKKNNEVRNGKITWTVYSFSLSAVAVA
jgi:hypothetical protein